MAVLPIRMFPDPVLREPALPVGVVDDDVRKLIRDMHESMRAAAGIGLAAPQVGVQRRVLVYDVGDGLRALVDPEILSSEGEDVDEEGCLSIPGLAFEVKRAERIQVRGLDESGEEVRYEAEEMHARVLQHEIDHLDGILYIDRLDRPARAEAMRVLRERALSPSPAAPPSAATRL
ncbi:MAG TPA: peptide deformylase [Actinomycetota bacterium]|nr:peptide deformylase [Actinomycetota bacterium]